MNKTHVLLINLGTPDSPSTRDVRRYLREFLMDRRVIDIPFIRRFLLVNGIIAPFRAPSSAKLYQRLWTDQGSPLKVIGEQLRDQVAEALGRGYVVALGMRYQNPHISTILKEWQNKNVDRIVIIPLYPQYASSTTGSTMEEVWKGLRLWENIPDVRFIRQFMDDDGFIQAFADIGTQEWQKKSYDHVVFSYHGLPVRQIHKASRDGYCRVNEKCCATYHTKNQLCYRAQCYLTSRLLSQRMGISDEQYTVCFQSRLGRDPWIQPYIDDVIPELIKKDKKKILAFSPSFVADCLETTIEIGLEYKKIFGEAGGEEWDLVPSLNTHPQWVQTLCHLIQSCQE